MGYIAVSQLGTDLSNELARVRGRRIADKALAGRLLSRMNALDQAHQSRMERIRAQIQAGTYDVDEKLDVVVDRIAEELENE